MMTCCADALAVMRPPASARGISRIRMSFAFLLQAGDDSRRPGIVAFAHFVDERHGVLQQRDFGLEALEQTLLRRFAVGLRSERVTALVDRLIDHRKTFFQRRGRLRWQRALFGVLDLLEAGDRLAVMLFGLLQVALDRLR